MRVEREWLRSVIFHADKLRRFTQDSPILPEVWLIAGIEFCRDDTERVDLLLSPHRDRSAADLGVALRQRLLDATPQAQPVDRVGGTDRLITRPVCTLSVSQTAVAASMTLREIVLTALPLTPWWERNIDRWDGLPDEYSIPKTPKDDHERKKLAELPAAQAEVRWMLQIIGVLLKCARTPSDEQSTPQGHEPWYRTGEAISWHKRDGVRDEQRATYKDFKQFENIARSVVDEGPNSPAVVQARALLKDAIRLNAKFSKRLPDPDQKLIARPKKGAPPPQPEPALKPPLWSIGLNRPAQTAIDRSVACTKADAASLLFTIKCKDLTWAIVDSGIDSSHAAFRRPGTDPKTGEPVERNAVTATYDFTRLRNLVTLDSHPSTGPSEMNQGLDLEEADRRFKQLRRRLRSGRALDWAELEPLLIVRDRVREQYAPQSDHGTHVAGILGGNATADDARHGMCPDINLYDLRVLDDQGRGDEFSIIAALQFIRYLNATSDEPIIHGVNLSLSVLHDVENFACGRTPICDECERLVASGVVVVAAAGNRGYETVLTRSGESEAYRAISITDPGNAESVITVGATHRFQPHTYGVSYFSSRGPTGDGRIKPDVLAPGERVYSTIIDGKYGAKDGTSMAAPHVSGVAAMIMARHREFLGQPEKVKRIIMKTATDLGRERYFQGAGMVDALRALQSV
jgi:subtilisin family serine protease